MHIAQKFEGLLEKYRPDRRRWSGQEMKGRIENPGYEKMKAIAKAMGFAPEVWLEESLGHGRPTVWGAESRRGR